MPLGTRAGGSPLPHAVDDQSSFYASPLVYMTGLTAGSAYPTADLAIYVPVRVKRRVVVKKLHAAVNAASGNISVALYDEFGIQLATSGKVAAVGSGQTVDVTDVTIGPGIYYLGVVADNTSITILRSNAAAPTCAAIGVLTEQLGTGAALPAVATWGMNQTLAYYPFLGLLVESTVA